MTDYVLYPGESLAIMQCLVYISDSTHKKMKKMNEKPEMCYIPKLVGRNIQAIWFSLSERVLFVLCILFCLL